MNSTTDLISESGSGAILDSVQPLIAQPWEQLFYQIQRANSLSELGQLFGQIRHISKRGSYEESELIRISGLKLVSFDAVNIGNN